MKPARSLAFLSLAVALSPAARAGDGSWAVNAGGNWSAAANWVGSTVATGLDGTVWFTNAITAPRGVTNDYAGGLLLGGAQFAASGTNGWTVTGNRLQFTTSAGVSTVGVASGSATLNVALAGTGTLVKAGAGTAVLSGLGTYAGATVLSNGTVRLGAATTQFNTFGTNGTGWRANGATIANDIAGLTDGGGSQARSVMASTRPGVAGGFLVNFTYTPSGNRTADGAAFILHNDQRGTNAVGTSGGFLGYGGITQSLAVALNIYAANTIGTRLFTNGVTASPYAAVTPVQLAGGNPIGITLVYDPQAQTITETLMEQGTTNNKTVVFGGVLVTNTLSNSVAWVGFSGGTGGSTAKQDVNGFGAVFNNTLPPAQAIAIAPGAVLDLNGTGQGSAGLVDAGGGGTVTNTSGSATLALAPLAGTASFSGNIGDAGTGTPLRVLVAGLGTQVLSGTNTYRGGTTIGAGMLSVSADENLGATNSGVVIQNGALQANGSFTNRAGRTLAIPLAGSIDVPVGVGLGLTNGFAASTGAVYKTGAGLLTIAQSAANPWTGPLFIQAGTVLAQGGNDNVLRNSVTIRSGATLRYVLSNPIINQAIITVDAGGVYDLAGGSDAIAYLAGAGTVTNLGGQQQIDLGTVTNTFSGSIGGAGSIMIRGNNNTNGVQVLSGVNTFSGGVLLQAGTLSISAPENLGAASGTLTFTGGTLRVTGTTLTNLDGRTANWASFRGALDIADPAGVFTVTNAIGGSAVLTKIGAGRLVLAGGDSSTNVLQLFGGVLAVPTNATLGASRIDIRNGATLLLETGTALADGVTIAFNTIGGLGKVYLTNSVVETINVVTVDGTMLAPGTWGATGSGAQFTNDVLFAGSGTLAVLSGFAAVDTDGSWGVNAGGTWGDTNNWLAGAVAYGTNSTAWFTNALTADRTVNNGFASLPLGGLTFGSPTNNWTVTNGAIQLVVAAGAPVVTVATNTATLGSILAGTQGLVKAGAGTLTLTTTNAYVGETLVSAGTLQFAGAGSVYSNGTSGSIVVTNGGTLAFGRSDTFGVHTVAPAVAITVHAGGLVQSSAGVFNTLKDLTLNGGELRANGGASATFPAFQLKGTVTVSGASASLISATASINATNQIQLGDNTTNGVTTFAVAEVTGNTNADLVVSAGFANGRNAASGAVPSGFLKTGAGTLALSGNNLNTGSGTIDGSTLLLQGGALNGPLNLINSATLVAQAAPGLAGEFYNGVGAGSGSNLNFATQGYLGAHLAALNPSLLYNFTPRGTNLDFDSAGWPIGVNTGLFEARWQGVFNAPTGGVYAFSTSSDDGSQLWIDGALVVSNNYYQGITNRAGTVTLTAGPHDIALGLYQGGGGVNLAVYVTLPGEVVSNRLSNALLSAGPNIATLNGDTGTVVAIDGTVLTVAQQSNVTFNGAISATGGGALRKLGLSTLTLGGPNSLTNWILGAGRLAITNDAQIGGAASRLQFDGGILAIDNAAVTDLDSHLVNWAGFNGGLDIAQPVTFLVTNALSGSGSFAKYGPGVMNLTADNTHSGLTLVAGGTMNLTPPTLNNLGAVSVGGGGAAGTRLNVSNPLLMGGNNMTLGTAAGDRSVVVLPTNAVMNRLFIGSNSTAAAAVIQQGGAVIVGPTLGGTDVLSLGLAGGGYGYYRLESGSLQAGQLGLGGNSTNVSGVFDLYNGSLNVSGTGGWIVFGWLAKGLGVLNVFNGSVTSPAVNPFAFGYAANGNSFGSLNLLTTGSVVDASANATMELMRSAGNSATVVNVTGGRLIAKRVTQTSAGLTVMNFDGGTLQAAPGLTAPQFLQGLGGVYIRGGGLTIDSSNSSVTIAQNLLAPTGSGVQTIPLTSGGSGYIGAPIVLLSGGGGTGATAIAQVDLATGSPTAGQVTNVLVTSPGVDYSTAPTVTFVGGGSLTPAVAGVAALVANASGGLSIAGVGTVALNGTNTYTGGTIISNGILLIGSTNALGSGSLTMLTNTAGIGPTHPADQSFVNWLTSKLATASGGILALGANSSSNLNLTALTNWSFGAAGGTYTYGGLLTIGGTNLYLGGGNGTLIYVPNLGTGTNVIIGANGTTIGGAVQLSGTNDTYVGTIDVLAGTLKAGRTNALGGSGTVVRVSNGTTLDFNGQFIGNGRVYVSGNGVTNRGALVNTGADAIPAIRYLTLTGDTLVSGPGRWDLRTSSGTAELDLANFTLIKTNGNIITLLNGIVSDGSIQIDQGILRFENASIATGGTGRITVGRGAQLNFWNFSGALTRGITMSNGFITVGAGTASVGSPVTLLADTTNTFDPGVFAIVQTNTIDGAGTLAKIGVGPVSLNQALALTGPVIVGPGTMHLGAGDATVGTLGTAARLVVTSGWVSVNHSNALSGAAALPVTVQGPGVLWSSNGLAGTVVAPLTLAGGALGGGEADPVYGNWRLPATVTVQGEASIQAPRVQLPDGSTVFDVTNGATLGVGGTLENPGLGSDGTGSVVKTGGGTLVLGAAAAYTGPTVVNGGTLRLQGTLPPVAGMTYWLDAADTSTVTLVAGRVSQWNDKSGNGLNFAQANTAMRPTLAAAGIGGRPSIRFDGLTNQLALGSATTPRSVFLVNQPTLTGNLGGLWGQAGTDFGIRLASLGWHGDNNVNDFNSLAFSSTWTNGIFCAAANAPVNPYAPVLVSVVRTNGSTAFAGTQIGYYTVPGGNRFYRGDLGEVLVYGSVLSDADRKQVEAYLTRKWITGGTQTLMDVLPADAIVQVSAGATLELSDLAMQNLGALVDGLGGGTVTARTSFAMLLDIGRASGVFSGSIQDGSGLMTVVKNGTGTQTLAGVNTYAGQTFVSNGTLLVNGSLASGTVFVRGGTLGGTGVLSGSVINSARVAPGSSPGVLTVGGYTQSVAGTLAIEIAGLAPGAGHDQLVVSGIATLGGTLSVTTNGYAPVAGNVFTVLVASAVSGTFSATSLPALDGGLGWDVQIQPAAVVLAVTGGVSVSGYDLAALGVTNGLSGYNDDADGDGFANLLEYVTGGSLTNPGVQARMNAARTNNMLALKFGRDTAATDATLYVEGSFTATNGAAWLGIATNIGGSWGGATNVTESGPSPVSVTVQDVISPATNRFLRLRVTRP